jgi:hypothetical protein
MMGAVGGRKQRGRRNEKEINVYPNDKVGEMPEVGEEEVEENDFDHRNKDITRAQSDV